MGYYTDISNSEYAAKDVALQNRMNGVNGHTAFGVAAATLAPQLLTLTIGKILNGTEKEGKGGVDNETSSEDQQRAELNKKLKKALNAIGADNEKQIDAKLAEAQNDYNTKITNAQNEVNKYKTVEQYDTDISNQKNALAALDDTSDPDGTKRKNIEKQIETLEADKKARQKAEKELAKVTETENAKLAKIRENALEAQEILAQLNELNSFDETETEKIQAQHTELSSFNKAYDNYKKTPSKETALALQKAFQDCPMDSPYYNHYKNLYTMYQKDIEGLLK